MKDTPNCPICNEIFLSESNLGYTHKTCDKKLDHVLKLHIDQINYDVYRIWLQPNRQLPIAIVWGYRWNMPAQSRCFIEHSQDGLNWLDSTQTKYDIPYFEPNFSNYKKLKEKINTYLTFM
jgi:hypothetical protein